MGAALTPPHLLLLHHPLTYRRPAVPL
jgi:hypothetical protein